MCWVTALTLSFSSASFAKPEVLAALFQQPKPLKTGKGKAKVKVAPLLPIPEEYRTYFKAKNLLEHPTDTAAIEAVEREILLSKLHAQSRTLEKDLEDVFYALEIKRGTRLLRKKARVQGLESYHRGLAGLSQFKWIYYWDENDSKELSTVCKLAKKPDEMCFALAKKISDAFPKTALETKALRELTYPASSLVPSEVTGDRLSQTYSEKKEKDEEDFQDVLAFYLAGKDIDLAKSAKEFISAYPKSLLRFRATFLMAESFNRTGSKKEATPLYQSLIEQSPLSFYAIVSSERLGVNLRDKVKKDPILVDSESFNPSLLEKITLERAKSLFGHKNFDEVGTELDTLIRFRNYNLDFLLYLTRFAYDANQNLVSFKFINELIQRRYDNLLSADLIAVLFPDRFLKEIEEQATLNKIDPLVVISLMKQESGFKAPILSSSGAMGLMQLMPFTAIDTKKDVVLRTLKDPKPNIEVGTKYIASLMDKYDGNIPFALAAYNAGPHRVSKWRKEQKPDINMIDFIEAIPFKETRDYVMAILRNRYWYQYRKGVPLQSVFDAWKVNVPTEASPVPSSSMAASLKAIVPDVTPVPTLSPTPVVSPTVIPGPTQMNLSSSPKVGVPNASSTPKTVGPLKLMPPAKVPSVIPGNAH
jgi:soluble lytic murein transglycosylase-like protein/TolA-binding protein